MVQSQGGFPCRSTSFVIRTTRCIARTFPCSFTCDTLTGLLFFVSVSAVRFLGCKCQCLGMILMHLPSALLRSNQRGRELPDHKSSALSAKQRRLLDLYVLSKLLSSSDLLILRALIVEVRQMYTARVRRRLRKCE